MNREKLHQEQKKKITEKLNQIKNKLIVMSGKGGVGKSTVAVNLAVELSGRGYKVGLMDVDFHGPNTLKMLNLDKEKLLSDGTHIVPLDYSDNLKVISIAGMLEDQNTAVIWRGPMKIGVIRQFISDVHWKKLDWLIIDSPPGTGDEPLTVAQEIKGSKAVIVTTPQEVSLLDVCKSIDFCNQINMPIVGIVENMSGYICSHCNKRSDLFKKGGGEKLSKNKKIPFLGAIPMEERIMEASDSGVPFIHDFQDSESSRIFREIVDKIVKNKK